MILSNMLWVPKENLKNIDLIRSQLTVVPKYDELLPIETYINNGDYFGYPRNFLSIPDGVVDNRVVGDEINIKFNGRLRHHQERVMRDWDKMYNQGITDYILNLQTGTGKTILALYIASILKIPFLVIVPREVLLNQWKEQILKFTNIKEIGTIRQKQCEYEGRKACVGLIHSICKDKYPEEFKNHFGLVIIDEVHKTSAYTFSNALKMFPAKYKIALSATLERQDGLEDVFFHHLGRNIISYKKATQPNPKIIVYQYKGNSGSLPFWLNRYDIVKTRACILSNLAKNKERNKLIADFAEIMINKGLQTLVIGERIVQLEIIKKLLHEKGFEDAGLYIQKTKQDQRRWLEKNSRCILATKQMLDIGVDIDTLRGLIFATPNSEVEQMVGRVRRVNDSVPEPVILDIWDNWYPEADRWAKKRLKYYQREDFNINKIG